MDDLERTSESPAHSSFQPDPSRMEMLDAASSVRAAEAIAGSRIIDDEGTPDAILGACREGAEKGERVTAILRAEALASARKAMRRIGQSRLGVVVHAISGHGGEELS